MSHVTYAVVEHDGGWAYKAGDADSETFATREAAHAAAARAAQEQRAPGQPGPIEYEDSSRPVARGRRTRRRPPGQLTSRTRPRRLGQSGDRQAKAAWRRPYAH